MANVIFINFTIKIQQGFKFMQQLAVRQLPLTFVLPIMFILLLKFCLPVPTLFFPEFLTLLVFLANQLNYKCQLTNHFILT